MLRIAVVCTALLLSPCVHALGEGDEREAVILKMALAINMDDFATAEATYRPLLDLKSRTGSGLPKLYPAEVGLNRAAKTSRENGGYDNLAAKAARWLKAYPQSSAAWLFAAKVELDYAWNLHGYDHGRDVPPEQLKLVHAHANKARSLLLEAPAAVRNTPWWYSSLINIERLATSDTAQEHSAMVAEGLRRHPAYYPIFFEHTVDLTSKAGADTAALAQFAKQAGNSAQDGQSMYARIYWYADWSQYRGRLFIDGKAEWPLMRAAFDDLLRRYPSDWNKSGYAYFACVAGDQAVARRLLAELGPRVSLEAWSAGGQSYLKKCQRWANPAEKQDGITL